VQHVVHGVSIVVEAAVFFACRFVGIVARTITAVDLEYRPAGYVAKIAAELLNSRPRASEVMNRQRPLNLTMVRKISQAWLVPADPLIQPYNLAVPASKSLQMQ